MRRAAAAPRLRPARQPLCWVVPGQPGGRARALPRPIALRGSSACGIAKVRPGSRPCLWAPWPAQQRALPHQATRGRACRAHAAATGTGHARGLQEPCRAAAPVPQLGHPSCGRRRPASALRARAGSRACFRVAADYLAGFGGVPRALVVGNHDLEGDEFETDAANLEAWAQARGPMRACAPLLVPALLEAARSRPCQGFKHLRVAPTPRLARLRTGLGAELAMPDFHHAAVLSGSALWRCTFQALREHLHKPCSPGAAPGAARRSGSATSGPRSWGRWCASACPLCASAPTSSGARPGAAVGQHGSASLGTSLEHLEAGRSLRRVLVLCSQSVGEWGPDRESGCLPRPAAIHWLSLTV